MRYLGSLSRWLLNINTIWGLMIVSAFLLCLAQHYLPTLTPIPGEFLQEGENSLIIRVPGRDKEVTAHEYHLSLNGGELIIASEYMKESATQPWLLSAKRLGDGYSLRWDYAGHGAYSAAVRRYQRADEPIPVDRFVDGDNAVLLRARGAASGSAVHEYRIAMKAGEPAIPPEAQTVRHDRPALTSARRTDAGYLLKWDVADGREYEWAIDEVIKTGRLVTLQSLTDAALGYAKSGFDIALGLVATMVLFLGLMKVGEDAGIVQIVARMFHPIIRFLFPDVPKNHPASGAILMNWTTTVLGLGNAATPFGLKAMKELESLNPHPGIATDSQVMLLGYNTAGFALLPATLIAVRKAAGCSDPVEIIGTCMVAGGVATVTAIVAVKLLGMLPVFSTKNAVVEQMRETGTKNGEDA